MTTLWLARHAETAMPNVFHGAESDVELGEHGWQQARAAAEWYAEVVRPTVVVSSGMRRAKQTAGVIAEICGVPHEIETDLHERRVGALGGTSFRGNEGPWPETIRQWCAGNADFTTSGAESFAELTRRLVPVIERVADRHPHGRVAIIAHGIVCKVLILQLLPDWDITGWERIGHCQNLASSELIRSQGAWTAGELLVVPPGVKRVNDSRIG